MCLAIYKPAGNDISIDNLKRGWEANDDGAGYCFIDEHGEIVIKKFMDWDSFLIEYQVDVDAYGDSSPLLIHFRITSKGATNIDNCHPFRVNDDMAIIHNGTITNIDIDRMDKRSDTKIFAEEYLNGIGESILDNVFIFRLAEGFIGYSKVCILHRTRGVFILNEEMGHWNKVDGCWYSNHSYEPKVVYKQQPVKSGYDTKYVPIKQSDNYVFDYYKEYPKEDTSFCDYCHKDTKDKDLSLVVDGFGRELNLCDHCLADFMDMYSDELCDECALDANTAEYLSEDLVEVYHLCDKCKFDYELRGVVLMGGVK